MTVTQLLESELAAAVPPLLSGVSVVALVPATELRGWAAEMAWAMARAAAGGGRRTVLVDCFVDAPTLHGVSGEGNDEGLVDAFEYGASLNRIVRQQPQADLYFIPAGTYSSAAEPLMQHPRWKRLSAGFRHEEALLLLYVAAEHLAGLAAEPDGVIVLAPQGLDLAVADAPALTEAVGSGLPLLAVVADAESVARVSGVHAVVEEPEQAPDPVPVPEPSPSPVPVPGQSAPRPLLKRWTELPNERPSGFTWFTATVLALLLALVSGGAWWLTARRQAAAAAAEQEAARIRAAEQRAARQRPVLPPSAPLPWAVQVATLPQLRDAYVIADSLAVLRIPTMIAPVRAGGRAFYRVYAGPAAGRGRADTLLAALRLNGTLGPHGGEADSVPLSLDLGAVATRGAAVAEQQRLRTAGVPIFILGQEDGTFRLFAGAYDAGTQTALLEDLLTPTGGVGVLRPRAGYVP